MAGADPFDRAADRAWDEARALLGVSADAGEADLRAAYLAKVRQFPPDREPERFEKVRDAYERLRDPRLRARQVLLGPDPTAPLASLVGPGEERRRYVGPAPWLAVLKEKKS